MNNHLNQNFRCMVVAAFALATGNYAGEAQGFLNLDFEAANVLDLPAGQAELVSTSAGLPGWTAYYGTAQQGQIFHNRESYGAIVIAIIGPRYTWPAFQGRYMALLDPGNTWTNTQVFVPASIGQAGVVPSDARVLQLTMDATFPEYFSASFNEQPISLLDAGQVPNGRIYEGDVSAFAGQTGELRLTSYPQPGSYWNQVYLDNIKFLVPEPSAASLTALGAMLLLLRQRNSP